MLAAVCKACSLRISMLLMDYDRSTRSPPPARDPLAGPAIPAARQTVEMRASRRGSKAKVNQLMDGCTEVGARGIIVTALPASLPHGLLLVDMSSPESQRQIQSEEHVTSISHCAQFDQARCESSRFLSSAC